jgi:hypothetical protein
MKIDLLTMKYNLMDLLYNLIVQLLINRLEIFLMNKMKTERIIVLARNTHLKNMNLAVVPIILLVVINLKLIRVQKLSI